MFTSNVWAQAAPAGGGGSLTDMLLPMALIGLIFYLLLIRPQQKKAKEHKALIEAVQKGDRIITSGGLIGKVTKVTDEEIEIQSSEAKLAVARHAIANVLNSPTKSKKEEAEPKKEGPQSFKELFGFGKKKKADGRD